MADIWIETTGRVTTITLNRPEKKNAITDAMYGTIAEALNAAAADPDVGAVLITGEGADFCAGNDIAMFAASNAGTSDISESRVGPFLHALSNFPKALVAAVTGRAIGVGTTMLLHCDLVYVAEDALLTTPFIDLGLVPEAASALLIPERIGHARAFAIFALDERLNGTRAAELGIANVALPAIEVLDVARSAAQRVAAKPASAVMATKRLMRDAAAISAAMDADRAAFLQQLKSPEAAAAFAAFAARKG